MKTSIHHLVLPALVLAAFATQAGAHRQWVMASVVHPDGDAPYVAVDAAVSESLFAFDAFPIALDALTITGPDGKPVEAENKMAGKRRSTFDVKLAQPGTYRVSLVTLNAMGSYTLNGETKRFRGSAATIPAGATDIRKTEMEGRVETFVTGGDADGTAPQPVGKGLEVLPLSSPAELVAGTPTRFRALLDGKPAADLAVTVVPGNGRFRAAAGDVSVKTDAKGEVTVSWPMAGQYWVGASWPERRAPGASTPGGEGPGGPGGEGRPAGTAPGAGGPGGAGGPPAAFAMPPKRYSYSATFEVAPF